MAATFYTIFSPDRATLLHWRGIVGFLALVLCTYLFFGMFAIAAVILISPAMWLFAKIPGAPVGWILSAMLGGGVAWLICDWGEKEYQAFQFSAAATAALTAASIQNAWRRTRPRITAAPKSDGQ